MKFKVFKVTTEKTQTLVFQIEVGEVRPGTSSAEVAVDYVLSHVTHEAQLGGVAPLMDSEGVHVTRWVILDDADIYWFIPAKKFVLVPAPVTAEFKETCRLGYCATKDRHYGGGDKFRPHVSRAGICPVCGGHKT